MKKYIKAILNIFVLAALSGGSRVAEAAKNLLPCAKEIEGSASAAFTETHQQAAGDEVKVSDVTAVDDQTFLINYVWSKKDGSVEDHSYRISLAKKCVVDSVIEQ